MLGICLGSQLLAHALGAAVRRHDRTEIGWYDLHSTPAGRGDPVLAPLGECSPVFQWHGCTFDLPAGATHLARTAGCEQQAFQYGGKAYGLQFHLETDRALIERWLGIPAYREEMLAAGQGHDEQAIRTGIDIHLTALTERADSVFNNFLDLIGKPPRRLTLPSR